MWLIVSSLSPYNLHLLLLLFHNLRNYHSCVLWCSCTEWQQQSSSLQDFSEYSSRSENAVVSSSLLSTPLDSVPRTLTKICIFNITLHQFIFVVGGGGLYFFMRESIFKSLASFKYLSIFAFYFPFWEIDWVTSSLFSFCFLLFIYSFIFKFAWWAQRSSLLAGIWDPKILEFPTSLSLKGIPICTYTIRHYGQIVIPCIIPIGLSSPPPIVLSFVLLLC